MTRPDTCLCPVTLPTPTSVPCTHIEKYHPSPQHPGNITIPTTETHAITQLDIPPIPVPQKLLCFSLYFFAPLHCEFPCLMSV